MYYFVYSILYILSLLPMRALYMVSDFLSVLIQVIGYRRDVVLKNLSFAFPELTERERMEIKNRFYRNFTDTFVETVKLLSASNRFIKTRFNGNFEIFDEFYKKGQKCQIHLGHHFNWELANVGVPLYTPYTFIVAYMPFKSKVSDRLFMKIRRRTGSVMLAATNLRNEILPYRNTQYLLTLVADQIPGDVSNSYWLPFFGRPTPFLKGPERGARIGNIPVIFCVIKKLKRGFYFADFSVGSESPRYLQEGELTRKYVQFLESGIREQPDMWLWSHRRWKREWKDEYQKLWIGEKPLKTAP